MDDIVSRLREGTTPGTYGEALRLEAADEIERLRAALHKIAYDAYTEEDESLTSDQPTMIWNLVAQAALEQSTKEPSETTVRRERSEWPDRQS